MRLNVLDLLMATALGLFGMTELLRLIRERRRTNRWPTLLWMAFTCVTELLAGAAIGLFVALRGFRAGDVSRTLASPYPEMVIAMVAMGGLWLIVAIIGLWRDHAR